jgi:glucan 1,3-beta-glucosidase
VADSSDINLYGGGFWNFRAGPTQSLCTGECQTNAVLYERNSRLFSYGISTINSKNLVMESGPGGGIHSIAVTRDANIGNSLAGFALDVPAFMAAYFRQSH